MKRIVVASMLVFAAAVNAAAHYGEGLTAGYNLDYEEALRSFRVVAAANGDDGTAHRLAAATIWMQLLHQQGAVTVEDYLGQARATHERTPPPPELARAFHEHLAAARAIAERRLKARPDDAEAHYQFGAVEGLHASYLATVEGRVRDSVGPARRAYKAHRRVLSLDPSRKDAALSVGTSIATARSTGRGSTWTLAPIGAGWRSSRRSSWPRSTPPRWPGMGRCAGATAMRPPR